LAKQPGDITLAELIEAVEGPVKLTRCCSDTVEVESQKCDREDSCELREPIHIVHASFRDFLSRVTLRDLAWNRVPLNLTQVNPSPESPGRGGPQE
jgi:DNA-binding IscR family transcriptional regulator